MFVDIQIWHYKETVLGQHQVVWTKCKLTTRKISSNRPMSTAKKNYNSTLHYPPRRLR